MSAATLTAAAPRAVPVPDSPVGRSSVVRFLLVSLGLAGPFSVFLPGFGGVVPPLVSVLAFVVAAALAGGATLVRGAFLAAVLLVGAALFSVGWSPSTQLALQSAFYFAQIAALVLAGSALAGRRADLLLFVRSWVVAAACDALLVVFFRVRPSAEIDWLQSDLAQLFVNPRTLTALFEDNPNNVLDPAKSGAFFVNANAGSAFLGVALMASLFLYHNTRDRRWLAIAVLDAVAVAASGSSAGLLILSVALAVIVLRKAIWSKVWCCLVPLIVLVTAWGFVLLVPAVWKETSVWDRLTLWQIAYRAIQEHPLQGLGFGGWDIYAEPSFDAIGSTTYPPHNLLLYTWVQMGVLGLAATLFFYHRAIVALRRTDMPGRGYIVGAVLWCVVYSMGDNTQVLNDTHSASLLAVLIGVGAVGRRSADA
jgi:O-antigen ligase